MKASLPSGFTRPKIEHVGTPETLVVTGSIFLMFVAGCVWKVFLPWPVSSQHGRETEDSNPNQGTYFFAKQKNSRHPIYPPGH